MLKGGPPPSLLRQGSEDAGVEDAGKWREKDMVMKGNKDKGVEDMGK